VPVAKSGPGNSLVVIGSVFGVLFAVTFALVIWLCVRRKQQEKQAAKDLRAKNGEYEKYNASLVGSNGRSNDTSGVPSIVSRSGTGSRSRSRSQSSGVSPMAYSNSSTSDLQRPEQAFMSVNGGRTHFKSQRYQKPIAVSRLSSVRERLSAASSSISGFSGSIANSMAALKPSIGKGRERDMQAPLPGFGVGSTMMGHSMDYNSRFRAGLPNGYLNPFPFSPDTVGTTRHFTVMKGRVHEIVPIGPETQAHLSTNSPGPGNRGDYKGKGKELPPLPTIDDEMNEILPAVPDALHELPATPVGWMKNHFKEPLNTSKVGESSKAGAQMASQAEPSSVRKSPSNPAISTSSGLQKSTPAQSRPQNHPPIKSTTSQTMPSKSQPNLRPTHQSHPQDSPPKPRTPPNAGSGLPSNPRPVGQTSNYKLYPTINTNVNNGAQVQAPYSSRGETPQTSSSNYSASTLNNTLPESLRVGPQPVLPDQNVRYYAQQQVQQQVPSQRYPPRTPPKPHIITQFKPQTPTGLTPNASPHSATVRKSPHILSWAEQGGEQLRLEGLNENLVAGSPIEREQDRFNR
jgi:hypothetical protein